MPKSPAEDQLHKFARHTYGRRINLGSLWGGFSGIIIGTGISLSIGLFYSSATVLIISVIFVSVVLGALLGQVMGSLLIDEVPPVSRPAGGYAPIIDAIQIVDLGDHKLLKALVEEKSDKHQMVIEKIRSIRVSANTPMPSYRPDFRMFELIVNAAHPAADSERKSGT